MNGPAGSNGFVLLLLIAVSVSQHCQNQKLQDRIDAAEGDADSASDKVERLAAEVQECQSQLSELGSSDRVGSPYVKEARGAKR